MCLSQNFAKPSPHPPETLKPGPPGRATPPPSPCCESPASPRLCRWPEAREITGSKCDVMSCCMS